MTRAVAITGAGAVSPAGAGITPFWNALLAGQDLRRPWSRGDLSAYPAPEVIEIAPAVLREMRDTRTGEHDTAGLLAAYAVNRALEAAAVDVDSARVGCVLSTTTAGVEALERRTRGGASAARCLDGSNLLAAPKRRWRGPTAVLSTACSSGLLAPALAIQALERGAAEYMIAGGVDVLLEYTVCGFNGLRLASPDRCRPFDRERKGVVLSEGAACFCLESLDAALDRGADVAGAILGYGVSCDADHVTAPQPAGIARAIRQALAASGVAAAEVGGVFVHGTGTPANDAAEVDALRTVFGDRLPPLTAVKATMGHAQAAAGSFALLAAVLALKSGRLPPTSGLRQPDPVLGDIDIVTEARPPASPFLMVNAFGFGGNNCVMLVTDVASTRQRLH